MDRQALNKSATKVLYKNIMIPTDFSEASWQAIQYALKMAKAGFSKLTFIHIIDQAPINPAIIPDRYVKELQAERIKLIQKKLLEYGAYCESAKDSCILHKSIVMPGRAASKILQMAQNEKTDLIILGSAGASRLMESVSLEVIDKASCPVISLPQRSKTPDFTHLVFLPRSSSQTSKVLNHLKAICASYQLDLHISPIPFEPPRDLPQLRLAGPEALLAIMLDQDPATRLQQKKWIQTIIRDEHMPLIILQTQSHLNNEN